MLDFGEAREGAVLSKLKAQERVQDLRPISMEATMPAAALSDTPEGDRPNRELSDIHMHEPKAVLARRAVRVLPRDPAWDAARVIVISPVRGAFVGTNRDRATRLNVTAEVNVAFPALNKVATTGGDSANPVGVLQRIIESATQRPVSHPVTPTVTRPVNSNGITLFPMAVSVNAPVAGILEGTVLDSCGVLKVNAQVAVPTNRRGVVETTDLPA